MDESPSQLEDRAVIDGLLGGDEGACVRFVRDNHRCMLALARAYVGDGAIADEVVQESWLAVLSGLGRFEGRSSLRTWVLRIVANRARTRFVRERRTIPLSALGDDEQGELDPSRFIADGHWGRAPKPWQADSPEAILSTAQQVAAVEAAIERLPARQRAVIVLRDVEGLDGPAVAELLDISEGNQRVLLHRARTTVREAVAVAFGDVK